MQQSDLLIFTRAGIYCPQADVYIDPYQKVNRAVITHAHADHARPGNGHYLCQTRTLPLLKLRLGEEIQVQGLDWKKAVSINGVKISFYPAGHILGSAQVRLEYMGEVWVVSGDYKLEDDGLVTPFEPVKCHTFITESTFGLPKYEWQPQEKIFKEMNAWWQKNQSEGLTSILTAYSLGKAQRLLTGLDLNQGKVFVHGNIAKTNRIIRSQICPLPETLLLNNRNKQEELQGALLIVPPGALKKGRRTKGNPSVIGRVSGWMEGAGKSNDNQTGFALSDHADWPGLVEAVKGTGAERIITMHGSTQAFAHWLREQGYQAQTDKFLMKSQAFLSSKTA